jgi:protoheme IX farnesyltransferase
MVPSTANHQEVHKNSSFRVLLLAATLMTLGLIVIGNLVRLTNSSQGCPDWPTCYGQWGLPAGANAQIQYAHRFTTFFDIALILLVTIIAAFKYRQFKLVIYPLYSVLALFLVEVVLGWSATFTTSTQLSGTLHLAVALAILSLLIVATVATFYLEGDAQTSGSLDFHGPYKKLILALLAGLLLLMTSGEFVVASGSGLSCKDWPTCSGQISTAGPLGWIPFMHSLLAGLVSLLVIAMYFSAWKIYRNDPVVLTSATAAAILFFGQVLIGALKVTRGFPADLVGVHAITTAALWAALCILTVSEGFSKHIQLEGSGDTNQTVSFRQRVKDFFMLTKPLIVALLLITTVTGMVMGGRGLPTLHALLWTLVGGALAAGGSSAINQYIDRDLDKHMQRTAKRPVASGRVSPAEGLAYGVALCLLSFFIMVGFVNLLAALLSLAGMVYYVLIYSILLKKATVQNIVIGGGAGAIPPLVGWAAVTGSLNVPSLILFAIIFFWTPPHFWALALVRTKDYARAGVPMLPVIKGEHATRAQIFIYTLELVGLTLLLPLFRLSGSVYLISAVTLGGALIYAAWKVWRKGGNKTAWMMYRYSSIYLALLFFAMILDMLLRKPG